MVDHRPPVVVERWNRSWPRAWSAHVLSLLETWLFRYRVLSVRRWPLRSLKRVNLKACRCNAKVAVLRNFNGFYFVLVLILVSFCTGLSFSLFVGFAANGVPLPPAGIPRL